MAEPRYWLRAGTLAAEIRPSYGGRITRFAREGGQDFFRPTPDQSGDVHSPFKTGCYPLVPYSNRIDHGRFAFRGRDIVLPPHPQASPHAMHGHGSVSAWTVLARAADRILITYRHPAGSWPFDYEAIQDIRLKSEQGLVVRIAVTNLSDQEMPVGLGLHPFFDLAPGTRARFRARQLWLAGPDFLPHTRLPVPPELDFSAGGEIGEAPRDHGFEGWDGRARIDWEGRNEGMTIDADAVLGHLILHRPRELPYFCLEPVSHVTNAFNLANAGHEDTGMRCLAPGETLAASCCFAPAPAALGNPRGAI